jgi:hypothetical protein
MGDEDADRAEVARGIIEANQYLTLATADREGRPWATPVWFAPVGDAELLWVSVPDARHSRNIEARPGVGIVVFDSHAPYNTGQGVYLEADAGLVPEADIDRYVEVFSRASIDRGGSAWTAEVVTPPARHRLYRATVTARWILDDRDRRVPVP